MPSMNENPQIDTESETETASGFASMGLSPVMLDALQRVGYAEPSPIQKDLIPAAMAGRDCLGNAPTGTGKTASFLVPILEKIDERDRRTQALILAPTRELAHQIGREFERLSLGRRTRAVALVGGESLYRQAKILQSGCQVVIATPGRLMDMMERNAVRLDAVKFVVLDEADQMLDIGFRPAIDSILESVPQQGRQTLLLSATMPPGVRDLTRRYLVDPVDVRLIPEEDATVPAIRQSYLMVHHENKVELLVRLLRREDPSRAIVFCRTKHGSDRLGQLLKKHGFNAEAMHGDLSQSQRNRVLHGFRLGRLSVLVATDVVGRGIDVPGISHVINYDLPEDPEHYVHRIGRTGRMGRDGAAHSFVLPDQGKLLDMIEKAISRDLESRRGRRGSGAPPPRRSPSPRPEPQSVRPRRRPSFRRRPSPQRRLRRRTPAASVRLAPGRRLEPWRIEIVGERPRKRGPPGPFSLRSSGWHAYVLVSMSSFRHRSAFLAKCPLAPDLVSRPGEGLRRFTFAWAWAWAAPSARPTRDSGRNSS